MSKRKKREKMRIDKSLTNLLNLDYNQAVDFLLKKYGCAQYNYFYNEKCASENSKASRSKEGLFIHHIDEDTYMNLSDRKYAKLYPFEAQLANRLVYCNYLEHIILHIKIFQKFLKNECTQPATTGLFLFMIPDINNFFAYGKFGKNFNTNEAYRLSIENNFEEYICILRYFINVSVIKENENSSIRLKKRFGVRKIEGICKDYSAKIVPTILHRLRNAED